LPVFYAVVDARSFCYDHRPVTKVPFLVFVFSCVEIAGLIKLGQVIGGGPVFAEILLSAVLGLTLVRMKGSSALQNIAINVFVGRLSLRALLRHDLLLLLAGVLLILPGLLSDAFGLYLIMRYLYERPRERRVDPSQQSDGPIDIEYQVHDEESRK
jgi:UPF0716 protein FxsA